MSDAIVVHKTPRKRGPKPKGYEKFTFHIQPDLAEWAKDLPDGLSGTLRRLLREEYERQQAQARVS